MAGMSGSVNAAQALRWNGESGRHWIAHRDRYQAGHQRLIPHLFEAAAILPGDQVLDIGCGCGATTIAAATAAAGSGPSGLAGRALGVDLSGPMLEVARRLAAEAGLANAEFEQGDAQIYPLRRDFYDVMISSFGVMFFDDPAAAFANIATALRRGGRLTFLCWQDDLRNELFAIPRRAFSARARRPRPADDGLFADPDQIAGLLSGAGWADVQVNAVCEPAWMGSDVADVMRYIGGMGMIRKLAAETRDEALTRQALAAIAEEYAARQRPDGVWVLAAAWLVTARRR
jgi:SAM-dependent methyltransferase